jgi:hypothetical protein
MSFSGVFKRGLNSLVEDISAALIVVQTPLPSHAWPTSILAD